MKPLKIHCFQHVSFEDPGCINDWVVNNGHTITYTKFFENHIIPDHVNYDWLIVMGGTMSVYEEEKYKWLSDEKNAIKKAIGNNKTVIGICLGSQLIAQVLGAEVYENTWKEIGWFDITLTGDGAGKNLFGKNIASKFKVFHWHGDTFKLPLNSKHLAYSEACVNQAFLYKENVLGIQFHFEVTRQNINEMINNNRNELTGGRYIQTETEILRQNESIEMNNNIMFQLLDNLNK